MRKLSFNEVRNILGDTLVSDYIARYLSSDELEKLCESMMKDYDLDTMEE